MESLTRAHPVADRIAANRKIRVLIGQRFALKDAARAHEALESRQTFGSTVLLS